MIDFEQAAITNGLMSIFQVEREVVVSTKQGRRFRVIVRKHLAFLQGGEPNYDIGWQEWRQAELKPGSGDESPLAKVGKSIGTGIWVDVEMPTVHPKSSAESALAEALSWIGDRNPLK